MSEDKIFKVIGEDFGDAVNKVNGLRIEIHADGSGNIDKLDGSELKPVP